jgi:hypothetical protein
MIKSLVLFDCGVRAVSESMAIPRLIKLLDLSSGGPQGVARQSAQILFSMARYPEPCRQMVAECVFLSLSRLLFQSVGDDELLVMAAQIISECARDTSGEGCYHTMDIPQAVLQALIKLLDSKDPDVLTAVVGAIDKVLKAGGEAIVKHMPDEAVIQQLCQFSPRNTPPLAFRKIASIIGRIVVDDRFNCIGIGQFIQEALSSLQDHRNSKSQVAASQALRKLTHSGELVGRFRDTAVLPILIPLLSSNSEESFVLAALVTSKWLYDNEGSREESATYFNISTIQRLICLLFYKKDWVVACAARGICDAVWLFDEKETHDILNRLIDSGGLHRLIGLLSLQDMDTTSAAANAIESLPAVGSDSNRIMLVWEGIIQALVPYLAPSFDFYPMRKTLLKAMSNLSRIQGAKEAFVQAGAIPHIVRLVDSSKGYHPNIIDIVKRLISSHAARSALVDAGIAQPLIQLLRSVTLRMGRLDTEFLSSLICHSYESCLAFRATGAEGFLVGHLSGLGQYLDRVKKEAFPTIQLLRSDMGTTTGHQMAPTTNASVALFRHNRHGTCPDDDDDQRVVGRAASVISKIPAEFSLAELVDISGPLIRLFYSQDLDTVLSATELLVSLLRVGDEYGIPLIWEGLIPALVPYLAPSFDFHAVQQAILEVLTLLLRIGGAPEALVQAGGIPHLVHLATSAESDKKVLINIKIFETLSESHDARIALVNAGIVQPLLRLAQIPNDSIIVTIRHLICHSSETCLAFKSAGAEGVLADLRSSVVDRRRADEITTSIQLLRSDLDGRRGHL